MAPQLMTISCADESAATAEHDGHGMKMFRAIEVFILQRIQDVEAGRPGGDARGEQFYCNTNTSLPIPVSLLQSNDYDSDGDPLTIVAIDTSILMGTLDCTTNPSTCTYQPPSGGWGQTFFRYTVFDGTGAYCRGVELVSVPRHRDQPAVDSAPPSFDSFEP